MHRLTLAIGMLSLTPLSAGAQVKLALADVIPVIVPITHDQAPYNIQAIWTSFSAGDTTSTAFRRKYGFRSCEKSPFFLRRAFVYWPCRAFVLTPWLYVSSALPDSALGGRVLSHIDSTLMLEMVADTSGLLPVVIGIVPGRTGAPVQVPAHVTVAHGARRFRFESLVLIGVPTDSALLTEDPFAQALSLALNLPPGSLARDPEQVYFLHPEARRLFSSDSLRVLSPGDTLALHTEVESCGSVSCIIVYPMYRLALPNSGNALYFSVRYDKGLLVERVAPWPAPDGRMESAGAWMLIAPSSAATLLDAHGRRTEDASVALVMVTWSGRVATVTVRGPR